MIITTTEIVPGREIREILGLVKGNTVRARHVGSDILASFKNVVGGEIDQYTKLMAESREQSIDRMAEDALRMGADAIVGVKMMTSMVQQHAAEILVYGTAVKLS